LKKVLFISGSGGLGHVNRDIAIARELRKINANVEIVWLSEEPATTVLREANEHILPEASRISHGNKLVTDKEIIESYTFNLLGYSRKLMKIMGDNADLILDVASREKPDLIIGDEAYDLTFKFFAEESARKFPFYMIYDFIGVDPVTRNPKDLMTARYLNKKFVQFLTGKPKKIADEFLFVGTLDDIRDQSFGMLLPNRREIAINNVVMLGYILPFEVGELINASELKRSLGYGTDPLIICTKGGTSAGKPLLELCANAYPMIKEKIPNVQMVIVCGPEVDPKEIALPEGVIKKGYVPQLYKHLACADICVTQCGGTTTLELTALQKPFIYFPLEEQFEQMTTVADRCKRLDAGIEMRFYNTTSKMLAETIIDNIGKQVSYNIKDLDGAKRAAKLVNDLLIRN
jgi:UDP:flavonoid glycosyltransferase YjiC (YdhE family)